MSCQLIVSYALVSLELSVIYQSIVRNDIAGTFDLFLVVLLTGISYFSSCMQCHIC